MGPAFCVFSEKRLGVILCKKIIELYRILRRNDIYYYYLVDLKIWRLFYSYERL